MKRKRKVKKGKSKKPRLVGENDVTENVVPHNTEQNSGFEEFENDGLDSGIEAESPSSKGTDLPEKPVTINYSGQSDERPIKAVYGRVKVKIKTSKKLDTQITSSDAPTQSDTDKSSQQVELEKQGVVRGKMEDNVNSLSESNVGISGNSSKKSGNIKIKSSRGFTSSSISPCSNVELVKGESAQQKEPESLRRDRHRSKQELDTSLEVIRKVMKMDAAEPFNVPVNPIALGIPDYFDVIDTPMDFGTICSNLEKGAKYMNSEDVYKDVQYIWDNCYKYNNKGDYIVELMKRVKKNFMKYWTAAGLYTDHSEGSTSTETIQVKDSTSPTIGKMPVKSVSPNTAAKKHHGLKKHKEGCLCAICVMMRRRQEREENAQMLEDHNDASDCYMDEEGKEEEISPVDSPRGEYNTSSNMENSEQEGDGDTEERREGMKMEKNLSQQPQENSKNERENEMTDQEKDDSEICEQQLGQRSQDEQNTSNQPTNSGSVDEASNNTLREERPYQPEDEAAALQQQKAKALLNKSQRAKMYERLRHFKNPMLFELCSSLFNGKHKSVWSRTHSLVRNEDAPCSSSMLEAMTAFMK